MILRAKTNQLFAWKLTSQQQANSTLNIQEMECGASCLKSLPRRLVLELTNACNLNCVMCGRNAANFKTTVFKMPWFDYLEPLFDTVEEVTLMGWGEPTVHPHFEDMLARINQHAAKKYFCTNGLRLDTLTPALFEHHAELIGVSLDGATAQTNDRIRRGSDFKRIVRSLEHIEAIKAQQQLDYPYINFVFCAMKSNLHELPDLVKLASSIGLEEVKVVFLTVFQTQLAHESLWDDMEHVKEIFKKATELGEKLGVALKLPYLPGEDPAGDKAHKDCFVGWRDFFLGSDGMVRPCMSTPEQLFAIDTSVPFMELWNHPTLQRHRSIVNEAEKMSLHCQHCYQSSYCNWNRKTSFLQNGHEFSPHWQ